MTITKKLESEESRKKFSKKYIIIPVLGLFILVVTQIWASNSVIAYGDKFEKLALIEKNLKMENQLLENEIAKNSSIKSIASKSAELGLTPQKNIQYIH